MKRKRIIICVVVTSIVSMLLFGCGNSQRDVNNGLPYDNVSDKHDLITVTYTEEQIEELRNKKEAKGDKHYDYSDLNKDFKIECIRKPSEEYGYYALLLLDDGRDVIIYITEDLIVGNIKIFDKYLSKDDFEIGATHEEILSLDPNTHHSPMSAAFVTYHTVREGELTLFFNYRPPYQDNPVVEEIRFYSHEDLVEKGEYFILEIDKYID